LQSTLLKIGIISDTHDDLNSIDKAISIFNREKVSRVVHAGDFIFPGVVERFRGLESAKLVGVLGNNDGEKLGLLKKFEEIGGELKRSDLGEIEDDDNKTLKIAVYHGTDQNLREAAIQSGIYDVFIHGHTHVKRWTQKRIRISDKEKKIVVLNPGTAHRNFPTFPSSGAGWNEDKPTVIIYDTKTEESRFLLLSEDGRELSSEELENLEQAGRLQRE
jgi:putative phosphoesterase